MKANEKIKKHGKYISRCKEEKNELDIKQIRKIFENNIDAILLDVRSNQEYLEGHLNGAINIPEYEIDKNIEKIINNKNTEIIIYCQIGIRSKKAYKKLIKLGYNNLYVLKDGIEGKFGN